MKQRKQKKNLVNKRETHPKGEVDARLHSVGVVQFGRFLSSLLWQQFRGLQRSPLYSLNRQTREQRNGKGIVIGFSP
jgi:hypothetical protein